jgi:hypothetical protein
VIRIMAGNRLRSAVLVGLLGLAGCAAPPVDPDAAPRFGEVKARFVTGRDVDVIEVRSLEVSAMRSATLVMADGTRVPSEQIDTDNAPELTPPPALPVVGLTSTTTTLVGQIASVTLIRLPDPPAYRQAWKTAKIEVTLGDDAGQIKETVAAPVPPP